MMQLRTEQRQMQHLHPYNNKLVPNSKEILPVQFTIKMIDWMIQYTKDENLLADLKKTKAAFERYFKGEYATEAMKNEDL